MANRKPIDIKKDSRIFYKMYITTMGTPFDLFKHTGEQRLYGFILRNCNRQTLEWTCNKTARTTAHKELDLSEASINRYLRDMVSIYKVLEKGDRGTYKLNKKFVDMELTNSKK